MKYSEAIEIIEDALMELNEPINKAVINPKRLNEEIDLYETILKALKECNNDKR